MIYFLGLECSFRRLLLIKACRVDKLPEYVEILIEEDLSISKFDPDNYFREVFKDTVDLRPLLVTYSHGKNVSSSIEKMSLELNAELISVALGSTESIILAENSLNAITYDNTWIFLENIHLAKNWLQKLESRLQRIKLGSNSKIILTSKMDHILPVSLLRSCRLLMMEEAEGIKFNIENNLSLCQTRNGPKELSRIRFLICWLHTIILERMKYLPIGWTSNYSFGEADLMLSLQISEDWLVAYASGRCNISPDLIPWNALRSLIGGIYGDKIDKISDTKILESMILYFMKPEMFDESTKINFPTKSSNGLLVPRGFSISDFRKWALELPKEELSWIGFEEDMNVVQKCQKGIAIMQLNGFRNEFYQFS